jgi:hypothetical protein
MSRFLPNAKRSLDSLLNLITDLAGDVLLFFRLLFRSRTALSAEVLFLRKQLTFYEERQVQPRRLNDSARFSLIPSPMTATAARAVLGGLHHEYRWERIAA